MVGPRHGQLRAAQQRPVGRPRAALHREDGGGHELDCYVVMPNHVHAVVRPLAPATMPLETVLQRWKGASSCDIQRHLRQPGPLWQRESFDRIIRDEEHLYRVIQYIGRNPKNAGLSPGVIPLWLRPTWIQARLAVRGRRVGFSPPCDNVGWALPAL